MRMYYKIILTMLVSAALAGCMGAGKTIPVEDTKKPDTDTTRPFIFVESSALNVDSDMMAGGFGTDQRAGQRVVIDSNTAFKVAYDIMLDSILGQEAADFNLAGEQPTLYRQYLRLRYDKVMRLMYQETIVAPITVSDSAVYGLYEEQKETFLIPDQYRARHIVIDGPSLKISEDSLQYKNLGDEELDSLAESKIVDLRKRVLDGANFDTLAILYSQDANSATIGGDLGYFQLFQMVSPFDSTVEHTPVGQISGVIKTEYGWHVVKVEDFSPEHYAPVDSVFLQLENQLKEIAVMARSRVFLDSLNEAATIIYDTAALMLNDSLHQSGDALACINPDDKEFGNDTIYFYDYQEQLYSYKRYNKIEGDLSFEDKVLLIRGVSVRSLLIQVSRKMGFYEDPEVVEWSEATIKRYAVSTLRKRVKDYNYKPTEEELRSYYDSHLDDYQVERPVTIQHIVFADSGLGEHVRDLLMSGMDFMEMVDQYYPGDPDIRRAAADLGEIGPDDMPGEFFAAALRTPVDAISHPVKTQYGFHIIKVLQKNMSIDFDQARIKIETILRRAYLLDKIRAYVNARLDKKPIFHWDMVDKLYYKNMSVPDFSQFHKNP